MKLLAAADIHLGRAVSRVASDWSRKYSPRKAFERLIDEAINREADAVLIAGDVAHRDEQFLEAYGTLNRGIQRLRNHDIPLIAVAGNHDTRILPELAGAVNSPKEFRLLGWGGEWESCDLQCGNGDCVRIWGWSFPSSHYGLSPLASFPGVGENAPDTVIGMVHGDRDIVGSRYAPLTSDSLENSGPRFWILGHIHAPDPVGPELRRSYYPGSLQALDPGETGVHGALWITGDHGHLSLERIPMGGLRYEKLEIDASDIDGPGSVIAALRNHVAELDFVALSARIRVTGETEHTPADIRHWFAQHEESRLVSIDDREVYIERIDIDVRPPLNLADMTRGNDTAARLAQLVLDLETETAPPPQVEALLRAAVSRLEQVDRSNAFARFNDSLEAENLEIVARRLLRQQGYALLREFNRQREEI